MNILMVTTDFPPVVGGISAHVYELSKALVQAGHGVSVIARLGDLETPDKETVDGIQVYRMPYRGAGMLYGLGICRYVRSLLPLIKPDIIHIHAMRPLEWYSIKDVPLAYTNHTSGYLKRISKGGFRRIFLLKQLFKKPQLFLAPSRELLEVPFSIAARKLFISNGVDAEKYSFSREKRAAFRESLDFNDEDIVCLLTRRLVQKNGVIFLARAAKYIKNKQVKFVLIGDGPERQSIEKEFQENMPGRVSFLGEKKHDEIIDYYSAADFSVLPSLMEATSISGLEAMAMRLPLVGTRVGGIPDLVTDSENGYLCNPADPEDLAAKIDLLLDGDYKEMGLVSHRLVQEKFSWKCIAEETANAYKAIL